MTDRFRVQPQLWPNQTVVVVGCGPSMQDLDLTPLRASGVKVIACNNAFKMVPWADVIYFADSRWWRWNGASVDMESGRYRVVTAGGARFDDERIQRLRREYDTPLAVKPDAVAGPDSGSMAINLAFHYGASRIILLGFDMRFTDGQAHWHEDHPVATPETNYTNLFAPKYPALVEALAAHDVEVIRSTPSSLTFIPEVPLAEALTLPRRFRPDVPAY